MEENNTPQPQTDTIQPTPESTQQIPHKQNKWLVTFFVVIILVLLSSTGFFAYQNYQLKQVSIPKPVGTPIVAKPSPEITSIPTESAEITPNIPADWTTKTSATCNIKVPLPPKKEPYYIPENPDTPPAVDDEGAFWQFREGDAHQFLFTYVVSTMLTHPENASGYIPGNLDIMCAPNSNNYTSSALLEKIRLDLDTNKSQPADFAPASISITNERDVNMWGKQVKVVNFTGGMYGSIDYYIFSTDTHLYQVSKKIMSTNPIVKDTVDQIFDNLRFLE
ncbi:hypothetical protein ACFL1P_01545 [Patescibacteria group bacterium]